MFPILFRTEWGFVYSFTVVWAVAIGVSLLLVRRQAGKTAVAEWLDSGLAALVGGLFVGRLSFLWTAREYFAERPAELTNLWQGGFTYHGALLGALLGVGLYGWWQKRPLRPLLALYAWPLLLLHAAGWAACWLEGCAYGAETVLGPLAADLPDQFGVWNVRFQTQVAGIAWSGLVAGLLLWRTPRPLFSWALLGVSLGQLVISLGLGTAVWQVNGWRVDTILYAAWATFALIDLMWLQFGRKQIQ